MLSLRTWEQPPAESDGATDEWQWEQPPDPRRSRASREPSVVGLSRYDPRVAEVEKLREEMRSWR